MFANLPLEYPNKVLSGPMSSASEPCVASTAVGGPALSSADCAPASVSHINPGQLVIDSKTPSHSLTGMGSSFSKSNAASLSPAVPPPSPTASRGFTAAVAGLRLTRAFANRRKKSEDVSKMMDRSMSQSGTSTPSHTQRIEATASISSSPAQLATQVLKKAVKKPQPATTQPSQPSPPPPPPKTSHVSLQPSPPLLPPKPSADHHSSIIPISPGISSAVNYIRMADERLDQDGAVERATQSSTMATEHNAEKESEKERDEVEQQGTGDKGNATDKDAMKDAWRKSDSTMSYHTIRPGSQPSRPVSMAESLQSNYTIVPVKRQSALINDVEFCVAEEDDLENSTEGDHNEPVPRSSSSHSPATSVRARERRAMSLSVNSPVVNSTHKLPPTPSSAAANFPFSVSDQRVVSPSQRTPANAQGYIAPSTSYDSYSTGGNVRTQLAVYTTQPQPQPHLHISTGTTRRKPSRPTSPIPIQHPRDVPHNPYTTFPPPPDPQPMRPASRLDRSLPALPPYAQRQPALSMSGGLGLAKRAVGKMGFGRALGLGSSSSSHHGHSQTSGYSSSSSGHTNFSNTPPSSYGAQLSDASSKHGHSGSVYDGLAAPRSSTSSNSGHSSHGATGGYLHRKNRPRHVPGTLSVSSTASHSTSASDSDAMDVPSGPNFGKRLRGPLRRSGGGVVFGRDLKNVVKETAVGVGKPKEWGGRWRNWDSTTSLSGGEEEYDGDNERRQNKEGPRPRKGSIRRGELKGLEDRKLPALVVRCAQHLLIWGIQEEGLFRIPGRALHVSRLRAEFDSGSDFDMTECSPIDLDPHAVASVFKAFLRELPESILTATLLPYFDAAMAQESKDTEVIGNPQQPRTTSRGPALPSGPRSTGALPPIRKAPSLSTLAMPTMTGLRPPSTQLLNTFRALLAQLPEENRDLIRTVSELIKAVALDSRATKMTLSNLLVVFYPSLNMSPSLLRILCEAEGIWEVPTPESNPGQEDDDDDEHIVLDVRKEGDEESYEDARDGTEEDCESMGRVSEDLSSSVGYNASTEDVSDALLTSFLVKPEAHGRKASVATSSLTDGSSCISTSEDHSSPFRLYSDVHSKSVSPPPFSSSAESLDTPATSSHDDSLPHLPIPNEKESKGPQQRTSAVIADSVPIGLRSSSTTPRRLAISNPVLVSGPVQFPSIAEKVLAPTASVGKRRSIPMLSLPNLSLKTASSDRPISPSASLADRSKRTKKPSLQLLFQKKSSSSLSSPMVSPAQSLKPVISSPYLQTCSASESSVSTPLSTVTAPQASTATLPRLPPKLDTPIESSALGIGMGLGADSVEPLVVRASEPKSQVDQVKQSSPVLSQPLPVFPVATHSTTHSQVTSPGSLIVRPGSTPIADRYHRAASPSPSLVLGPSKSQSSQVTPLEYTAPSVANHFRPNPTSRSRGLSTSSSTSSNHLGLLDEDIEQKDWSKSVLLAADVDGGWTIHQPGV
ncbi:Rho GTPase-activating protein gacZ [Termitomyces sp. T112]|nr:Rho GTPase-activating protein gacZ [Termitomyces sp. T112]